jgi:hypothetical protein
MGAWARVAGPPSPSYPLLLHLCMCLAQDKIAPLESEAKEEELKRAQAVRVQRVASRRAESMQVDVAEVLREDAEVEAVRQQVCVPAPTSL